MDEKEMMTEAPVETMADFATELEASLKQVKKGDTLTGTVAAVNEDSILVDLKYYAQGVISRADFTTDTETPLAELVAVGDEVTATVVKKEDADGNIVLSRKKANEEAAWAKMEVALAEGTTFTVKIDATVNKGVVANVDGLRAFIPASKLAAGYVENTEEWVGKEIGVRAITVDKAGRKLVLSGREVAREKRAEEKSRRAASATVGAVVEGTVETIKEYGAFIRLESGASGLLHISQVSDKRLKTLEGVLEVGQKVTVTVRAVENGKISLTMRNAAEEKPAEPRERKPREPRERREEEPVEYKSGENATTGLAALLAGLKID